MTDYEHIPKGDKRPTSYSVRDNKSGHWLLLFIVVTLPMVIWQLDVVIPPIGFVRQRIGEQEDKDEATASCNWRNGVLVEKPCSSNKLMFKQTHILFVGDSVTRYVYFGLVQTLCGYTGCDSLPQGGVARVRCSRHSTIHPETGFRMSYINHHYGSSPNKIISNSKEPIDIVYWQSGLWLLADTVNKTTSEIKQEYSIIISEARSLCESNSVKHFYVVDTMANLQGLQDNLDYTRLNRLLSQQWSKANLTRRELQCLHRLDYRSCVVHDWQHIQKDQVHPTVQAAASMAPWLWAGLGMGGHALLPCDTPIVDGRRPESLHDEWCVKRSPAVLKHQQRGG